MKNNIKLYTIDLDGTLLDKKVKGKHSISKANIDAITKARKEGIHIVVSTGRAGKAADEYVKMVGGDYSITGNGSMIHDSSGNLIYSEKLSVKKSLKVLEVAQKYKLSVKPNNIYHAYGVTKWHQAFLPKKFGWKISSGYTYPLHEENEKLILFGVLSKKKILKIRNEIADANKNMAVYTSFNDRTIEVTSERATKGHAAQFVADILKIKKSEIAHIGDSMNDSSTVGHVGKLIAMKNSAKRLKAIATHIGPHYKNGGVAKVLNGQYKKIIKK